MFLKFPDVHLPLIFLQIIKLKEKIIEKVHPLFHKVGPRTLTMDDVSEACGMSKKTLYQHFPNKEELIEAVVEHTHHSITEIILEVQTYGLSAIEEMYHILERIHDFIQTDEDVFMMQLEKYYPNIYHQCHAFTNDSMYLSVCKNLQNGSAQNLYRDDINIDLSARLFLMNIMMVKTSEIFADTLLGKRKLTRFVLDFFLRSMATEKGITVLTQKLQAHEN